MSLWAFRCLLWYICILMVQPQNRFPFLYSLHIADISVIMAVGLHLASAILEHRPIIRFGSATATAIVLFLAGLTSLHVGVFQTSSVWNDWIDMLAKSVLILILVGTTAFTIERIWAVQATMMLASLWWIKGGLRLAAAGATYSGDRIIGPAVSLIENPNSFAYMMCLMIPIYLYFYQQTPQKYMKMTFLTLALCAVYIVFKTGSRTGFLILVVLGLFLLPKYGARYKFTLVVAGAVIFFILPYIGGLNMDRFRTIPISVVSFFGGTPKAVEREDEQSIQSADERAAKNRHTWALIKRYPVFGVGIGANEKLFPLDLPMSRGQVHCEILMAGRQMGLIGMSFYAFFLALLFVRGLQVQRLAASWWPAISDLGWTFKMQALVFLVGGAFSPLPWNVPEFVLVGAVAALYGYVWLSSRSALPTAGGEPAEVMVPALPETAGQRA